MDQSSFHFHEKKRVVVKIGSSSLNYEETGNLNFTKLEHLVRELCNLRNRGMDVCLGSSGAIAVGRQSLGMTERPRELSTKQACAAVGQGCLMMIYEKFFAEYSQLTAQVLLTKESVYSKTCRIHARETFEELLAMNVVPIVIANDAISVDEDSYGNFGDNDTMSADVAALVEADLLIMMSDIEGLYTDAPRTNPAARFVHTVNRIDEELEKMGKGAGSAVGTGGMATKIEAAKIATEAGADMVIANGDNIYAINDIMAGKKVGTLFLAKNHRYDGENELGPERDAYRMERRLKRNIQYRMAVGK